MRPDVRLRFTGLLTVATVGVYLLVMVGATAALADAAEACVGWPLCGGPITFAPAVVVALGHRLLAAVVGLIVVATAVRAWRRETETRVRAALAVALVLYPVQVALGAVIATTGAVGALPGVHLAAGMGIFGALVVALAWHLEADAETDPATDAVEPAPAPEPVGPRPAPVPPTGLARVKATLAAYVRLTKPRLMWLLCLVASAGMALASGPGLSVQTVVATLGGGVLAIGASGTFNHVLERDVDQKMQRTSDRPVATHQVPVRNALAFGVVLAVASVAAFLTVNVLAAALGVAAIVFYSVVYTLVLKPNTVQNTVIGGAAGALPALIGWAAVTGTVGLPALALAGVIFLWTPAHFYNLALAYREDYERGGFPMMPVVRGEAVTRKHILWYLGATLLSAGALSAMTDLGWLYAATSVALGAVFLWAVVRLHRERDTSAAFRAFHASNVYLGALLLAVVVDALAV
ncbi:MAG: heme o synthase [Haloarculaceae archaeon]